MWMREPLISLLPENAARRRRTRKPARMSRPQRIDFAAADLRLRKLSHNLSPQFLKFRERLYTQFHSMSKKRALITAMVVLVLAGLIYLQVRTWQKFEWHKFAAATEGANFYFIGLGAAMIYFHYYL